MRGLTGGLPTAGRADWDLKPPVRSALPALAALLGQRGGGLAFRRTVPGCGLEHAQSEPVVVVAVDRSFEFRHVTCLDGLDQLPVHLDILGVEDRREDELQALLAGDVGRLSKMGANNFLLHQLGRFGLLGLDLPTYADRIRAAYREA